MPHISVCRSLEADLLLNEAKAKAAQQDFDGAKQDLDEIERDYPMEWAEAMGDPNTRITVEYIRSH